MQVPHSLRHSTPTFHPRPALQTQGTRGGREQQWAARGDQDGAAKALGEGLRPGPDPGPRPRAAHVALRLGTATLGATVRRTSGVSSPSFPDEPLTAPRSCRADVYTNRRKAQLGSLWGSARGFAGVPGFVLVRGFTRQGRSTPRHKRRQATGRAQTPSAVHRSDASFLQLQPELQRAGRAV